MEDVFEAKKEDRAVIVDLTTAYDTYCLAPWPHMIAVETSTGQAHDTYVLIYVRYKQNVYTHLELVQKQKFHPWHW